MAMLASSLEKFQTSAASILLVALQGRAVSVCGKPKEPHSTFMLLLEDQESHWEAKHGQSLSEPKERRGARTFRDFPFCLLDALPFLRSLVQKALLRDRVDHGAVGPRRWKLIVTER